MLAQTRNAAEGGACDLPVSERDCNLNCTENRSPGYCAHCQNIGIVNMTCIKYKRQLAGVACAWQSGRDGLSRNPHSFGTGQHERLLPCGSRAQQRTRSQHQHCSNVMYRDRSMAPPRLSKQSLVTVLPHGGRLRPMPASCRSVASESAQVSGGLTSASYVQLRFIPVCKG